MSWRVVAERDGRDPFRSMSALLIYGGFALVFGLSGYLQSGAGSGLTGALLTTGFAVVPLASFGLAYAVVAGKRDRGSLRVVLSYPHTRREVVLGSAIGRAAVAASAVTVGYVTAAAVFVAASGAGVALVPLVETWLLTCLFAVAITGVGVGLSAAVRTTNQSIAACVGAYILFLIAWAQLPALVRFVVHGFHYPAGPPPTWARVFVYCNPATAFRTATRAVTPGAPPLAGPVYAGAAFAVLVLVAWALAVPLLGSYRFERTDL